MHRSSEPYVRIPAEEEEAPITQPNQNTSNQSQDPTPAPHLSNSSESGPNSSATNLTATNVNNDAPAGQQTEAIVPNAELTDNEAEAHTEADSDLEEFMIPANLTLTQLLVEREYHRRGSSACSIILSLVLFRLWIEALFESDIALMFISFFMTTYLMAWRRHRATIENQLTERIEAARMRDREEMDHAGIEISGGNSHTNGDDDEERERQRRRRRRARRDLEMMVGLNEFDQLHFMTGNDHIDIEVLGFQAQLALAIMESQRHMMQGGYGRPDGEEEQQMLGVSEETKASWNTFHYDVNDPMVQKCADLKPHKNEDPSCCICLCEYEEGEVLTQLGCGHVYHKDCLHSWCENHTRCPLCNLNLEGEQEDNGAHDSIV